MPSSAAERKRKQIERLKKEGKYEEFKRKQSDMQNLRRQKLKRTLKFDEKVRLKKKRRDEQRRYRWKKLQVQQATTSTSVSPSKV